MNIVTQCIQERYDLAVDTLKETDLQSKFYIDKNKEGCLKSFGYMLNNYSTDDYRLHLQDDIIFADNLKSYLPKLKAYMQNKEIHLLSIFAPNRKLILQQYKEGKTIVPFPNYLWLQASIFSPRFQSILKKEYNNLNDDTIKDDDVFVAYVLKKYNIKAYVHLPSLVQHNTEIKSSLGHANSKIRESKVFDKNYITNLKK